MKELGEELSILRKSNGVSREEASNDLGITLTELECLENGNFKVFKDVYELKRIVLAYAKYLGLPEEKILDEFNDYLFEKTSKISKIDVEELKKKEEEEKVSSPYTKIGKTRYDVAPIVLLIVLLVISLSFSSYIFCNSFSSILNFLNFSLKVRILYDDCNLII